MYFRVAFQVVMGQVGYSRSGIALLLLGQRVAATTNQLAQLHRFSTSCGSGQFRVTADGESALSPIDPVGPPISPRDACALCLFMVMSYKGSRGSFPIRRSGRNR
jgi:hypothetical protein